MPSHIPFSNAIKLIIPSPSPGKGELPALQLSEGEIINGMVLEAFDDNQVLVNIKGQKITAQTQSPLTPGEKVSFSVEKVSPQIVLQLLENTTTEKTPAPPNTLAPLLRARIPQKTDVHHLLNDILAKMSDKDLPMELVLGKELFQHLKEGIDSFVYRGQGKMAFFKEAISKSGLVFEKKFIDFLQGKISEETFITDVRKDIKGILLESAKVVEEQITVQNMPKDPSKSSAIKNVPTDRQGAAQQETTANIESNQKKITYEVRQNIKTILVESAKIAERQVSSHDSATPLPSGEIKGKLESMLHTIKQFIDNIEIGQIANHMAKEEKGGFHLQIPFANDDTINTARLYVYTRDTIATPESDDTGKGASSSAKKDSYYLVFFLEMKKTGDMRVDVYINKNLVNCIFTTESKKVATAIEGHASDLVSGLKAADFSATVRFEVKKEIQKSEAAFEKDFSMREIGMIDLVV